MTPHAIAQTVAKLYTAAGRHYGKVEFEVYAEALHDIDDETGAEACRNAIRNIDLGTRAPTPKDVLDAARAIQRRRRDAQPSLPDFTGPLLPEEENLERVRRQLEWLRSAKQADTNDTYT